jgi:predicted PurR-regulated permease PerM
MTKSTLIDQLPNNVASKIQAHAPKQQEVIEQHIPIEDIDHDMNLEDVINNNTHFLKEENGSHLNMLQQQIEQLREELHKSKQPANDIATHNYFTESIPSCDNVVQKDESIITQVYKILISFFKNINYKGLLLVFLTTLLVYSTKVDSFIVKRLGETMYLGYTHYFKSAILSILIYFIILK